MKIKGKLVLNISAAVLFILLVGGILIYTKLKSLTEENIKKELMHLNEMSFGLIRNMANTMFVSHLRLEAEKNRSIAEYYYEQANQGIMTQDQAKKQAADFFLSRKIGKNGFVYCIDSSGKYEVHPQKDYIGKSFTGIDFIAKQIKQKEGYLQYNDPKTNDIGQLPNKALYMVYFKPWDWIISVSIYKSDLHQIINTNDLMLKIIYFKPSETGYSYVFDNKANMISHPHLGNFYYAKDTNGRYFVREMLEKKNGEMTYWFKNVADKFPKKKITFFKYLPELDWVVVSTSYSEDVYRPVEIIRNLMIGIGILLIAVLLGILFTISSLLTKPIHKLMGAIQEMDQGNLNSRAIVESSDEIGELAATFNKMAVSLQGQTENLENKVAERTRELESAFKELQDLKTQQDGDYFLTSLLLKPLFTNEVQSERVKIEFFLSQKKKFVFRKREAEIGGDVCIAHSLSMKGKPFVVFVNGDAMGKSLQGAGGALVMGAVFNAFVARIKNNSDSQNYSPEKWLKECYDELHDIFVSFDGSMMISAVIGAFDEINGTLYYFNAEHPFSVLYRAGKASFIESELLVRKIGTIGLDKGAMIKTFCLCPGDGVIFGSDGRDDLSLGNDPETGLKIVNEDETLFLKVVERAGGSLKPIVDELKRTGELTDDLSLLKIHYLPNEKSNYTVSQKFIELKSKAKKALDSEHYDSALDYYQQALEIVNDLQCFESLVSLLKKTGREEKELFWLEKACLCYPSHDTFLYRAALLLKKQKNYQKSLEYSERFAVYYPEHLNNLIILADSCRILKRYGQCEEFLKKAETLDSKNENILKLKAILEKEREAH